MMNKHQNVFFVFGEFQKILEQSTRAISYSAARYGIVLATTCWRIGQILWNPDLSWGGLH